MLGVFQVLATDILLIVLSVLIVGIVAILVGALWLYGDAESRGMDATVWVVLLIIASVLGSIIGFVIVLLIYLIVRGDHPVGGAMPYGYWPYPAAVPQAACPVCGRPMTWYSQYGRWYCPFCAQYR